jgi:carbon-monoxide dehydrogenase medium subunit
MLSSFKLSQPTTVEEVSKILSQSGEKARIYAGGAELLILLRHQLLETEILVDIKKIGAINSISADQNGLRIGACVTHQTLADDPLVRRLAPAFACAESQVANARVRHQGTLGGNLCFNDPHSDPGTILLVHNASLKLANYKGERELPLAEFFYDAYTTALRPNEILCEVAVPPLPQGMIATYLRLHRYQRPTLGVAAGLCLTDGTIAECRLAVGCAGPMPLRLYELEGQVKGATLGDALKIIDGQNESLRDRLRPVDDLLGSAAYKLYMARVMIGQALERAAAGESNGNG